MPIFYMPMPNLLASEQSQYLRQHADNPVAWRPWGPDAFSAARSEEKPLLVSIGYSSCHWCHVMAHESFENADVANIINGNFIPIKVDKEEFPDVDGFYMSFLTRLTGNGGWPLNVFVNHHGAPFYGLTYRDAEGFSSLLTYVAGEYDKNDTLKSQEISTSFNDRKISEDELEPLMARLAFTQTSMSAGPQFPQGLYLGLAWQKDQRDLVNRELENLITKGLFDHIEGGWFRYSVDPGWKIPHFEKMLYDQAVLLELCADSFAGNEDLCGYAIEGTISWLKNRMLLPNGMYGSATDADTADGEGMYYVIDQPQSSEAVDLFRILECGRHEGKYQPWIDLPLLRSNGNAADLIEIERENRRTRAPLRLDDKAVFSWNAYLCYSLLKCATATGSSEIQKQALDLYAAVTAAAKRGVRHVYYPDGTSKGNGYLEDWAAWALLNTVASEPSGGIDDILSDIETRFFSNDRIWHTTEKRFESQNLWQDTPFPSGGSVLLRAMAKTGNHGHQLFGALRTSIAEIAVDHPQFFAGWLRGYLGAD